MTPIYFDNAATTPIRDEVIESMAKVMKHSYGNASSTHSFGRSSKVLIEGVRNSIASYLNVSASEIVFTSGGTEADNLALRSAARDLGVRRFVTSKIEHHAILHTLDQLQLEYNLEVDFVNLTGDGQIDYEHLELLLQGDKKTLVSLMHINNEIGNILDISRVALLCKSNKALFHSDTVQSVGHYNLNLKDISIDFLAASAHKFHGPKGVGFAFIRKNSGLKPLIFGGEQERGIRAGTESVHNIVGLGESFKLAYDNLEVESAYVRHLKLYFMDRLKGAIPKVEFNGCSGDLDKSTYTSTNVRFPLSADKGAMFMFQLDLKGIACSKGSACQSGSSQNSHVLNEILSLDQLQKPSLRFSFSIYNTKDEVDYVIDTLKALIET